MQHINSRTWNFMGGMWTGVTTASVVSTVSLQQWGPGFALSLYVLLMFAWVSSGPPQTQDILLGWFCPNLLFGIKNKFLGVLNPYNMNQIWSNTNIISSTANGSRGTHRGCHHLLQMPNPITQGEYTDIMLLPNIMDTVGVCVLNTLFLYRRLGDWFMGA